MTTSTMVERVSIFHRIACRFGLTQTFVQGGDDTGVWGECTVCGKRVMPKLHLLPTRW